MNNQIPSETVVFNDLVEFDLLKSALDLSDDFVQVEVQNPYSPVGLEEYWYLNVPSSVMWRLVRPDPPYRGIWAKV